LDENVCRQAEYHTTRIILIEDPATPENPISSGVESLYDIMGSPYNCNQYEIFLKGIEQDLCLLQIYSAGITP